MDFEERVKELMRRKGMNLNSLSIKMDILPASLCRTLKKGNPRMDTIKKIADALDVGVDKLFPEE